MPRAGDAARSTWRGVHLRAAIPYVVAGAFALVAVAALGHETSSHLTGLEGWIRGLGPWGPIAFVALFAVATSLFVPNSLMAILAGVLFGLWWGVVAVVAGALVACSIQYALSRYLLGSTFQRVVERRPRLARLMAAIRGDEFRLQFMARLTPLSPTLLSYAFGAGALRFLPFVGAMFAEVPGYFVQTFVGVAGEHAVRTSGRSDSPARDAMMFGGLVVSVAVTFLIARAARRVLDEAEASVGDSSSGGAG